MCSHDFHHVYRYGKSGNQKSDYKSSLNFFFIFLSKLFIFIIYITRKKNKTKNLLLIMADTQGGIKLRYKRGTCFGCQKCLYCGVDLQQQKCKCKTSMIPNKKNRTTAVKYAFTRIFSPDWTKDKISFIQEKVLKYNYSINLKNTFNFSLCS